MGNPLDIKQWTDRYVAQWNELDPAARASVTREPWARDGVQVQAAGGGLDILALDGDGRIRTDHQFTGVN